MTEEEALDYVLGYTGANDVSVMAIQNNPCARFHLYPIRSLGVVPQMATVYTPMGLQ